MLCEECFDLPKPKSKAKAKRREPEPLPDAATLASESGYTLEGEEPIEIPDH